MPVHERLFASFTLEKDKATALAELNAVEVIRKASKQQRTEAALTVTTPG